MVKWFTIILALIGLSMGIWTVATSKEEIPKPPPAQPPSVNPFPRGIAATGLVEASTRNVQLQAPEPGLVMRVMVEANETVRAGDPLFELDARLLDAELLRSDAALKLTTAELERLRNEPRAEDVTPLEAAVDVAKARLADAKDQLSRIQDMVNKEAGTDNELARKRYAVDQEQASLARAQADLTRVKAGAWSQDIAVAQQRVAQAESDLKALRVRRERLVVRAPIDGTVLKRLVEPGEYADTNPGNPAMVLGDLSTLNIRAQVDEEDAPLLANGAAGKARLRGAVDRNVPLKMLRIEPLARGKIQITGQNSERVDTRVIDVLFQVEEKGVAGMYPGQMVDVFIEVGGDQNGANK